MSKSSELYCKLLDFDLSDLDSFDHLKGLAPKRLYSPTSSLFSAKNPEKLVISSEIPIDSKEISVHFQQDSDFPVFSSNYPHKFDSFGFDGVFSTYDSQESLFLSICRRQLADFLESHESSGVLLLGPSRSAKNYLLRGGEHKEKGLFLRVFEELQRLREIPDAYLEAVLLYKENTYDLLVEDSLDRRESKISKKIRVSKVNELKNVWDLATFKLGSLASQIHDPNLKDKGHLILSFSLEENTNIKYSVIRVGDLGSEQSVESRGLRRFFGLKSQEAESILAYRLQNENYSKLSILTVLSNQSPIESNRFYLEFSQKLTPNSNSNLNPLKPPKSPTYRNHQTEFPAKSPESLAFTREKAKGEDLDRDFSNLIERYNKSKQLIESIPRKPLDRTQKTNEKSTILMNNNKPSGSLVGIEQDIMRLKSHIAEKLESSGKKDQGIMKSRVGLTENTSTKSKLVEKAQGGGSLAKLKNAFQEKETMLVEKLEYQRKINEELRTGLREYVERKDALEREGLEKDSMVQGLGERVHDLEEALMKEREVSGVFREKGEELRRENEKLAGKLEELDRKFQKKTQKVNSLKQRIEISKSEETKGMEKANSSIRSLQKTIEDLELNLKLEEEKTRSKALNLERIEQELIQRNERISQMNKLLSNQEDEFAALKERLNEEGVKQIELQRDQEVLKAKISDLKESLQMSEAKLVKTKAKCEDEKKRLLEEKTQQFEKKQAKYKRLKELLREHKQKETELLESRKTLEQEISAKTSEKHESLSEIDNLRRDLLESREKTEETLRRLAQSDREKLELQGQVQSSQSELSLIKAEGERLRKALKGQEKKNQDLEEQAQKDFKEKAELKQELNTQGEDRGNLKEMVQRLETQLEFVQNQHNEEIGDLDRRAEKLIEDMRTVKEENQEFRAREGELRKAVAVGEETIAAFKEKYLKLKFTCRGLKNHLKEVEERLKDYMTERQLEMKEMEITKENTQRVINGKMKMLDEIQNMVKNYRVNNRKLDFSGFA